MNPKPFRTVLKPTELDSINHSSKILMVGSCFSEHIGTKLDDRKFDIVLNPFGIIFHPLSLSSSLNRIINNKSFTKHDLRHEEGRYISFYHHGEFNDTDPNKMLDKINSRFEKGKEQLLNADFLFITWGTAFGYSHAENESRTVANCHKIPNKEFIKSLSTPEEITEVYTQLFNQILEINPNIKIVLTISPVKHLKDGLVNNNVSKSVLHLAAHKLKEYNKNIIYFPAFELINDDLRDYRFYAKDMAHPSEEGVEYVWEFFKKSFWSEPTSEINKRIEAILNAVSHRPLHPENKSYLDFLEMMKERVLGLNKDFPLLDLRKEMEFFESK